MAILSKIQKIAPWTVLPKMPESHFWKNHKNKREAVIFCQQNKLYDWPNYCSWIFYFQTINVSEEIKQIKLLVENLISIVITILLHIQIKFGVYKMKANHSLIPRRFQLSCWLLITLLNHKKRHGHISYGHIASIEWKVNMSKIWCHLMMMCLF